MAKLIEIHGPKGRLLVAEEELAPWLKKGYKRVLPKPVAKPVAKPAIKSETSK